MKKTLVALALGCALVAGNLWTTPAQAGPYFHSSEIQWHADVNRDKGFGTHTKIWTATFQHYSEWKYGDVFAFLDIEGKDDYKLEPAQYYGEFAGRFSLDKIINGPEQGTNLLGSFLKETYIKLEIDSGTPVNGYDYIDDSLLAGVSFDLDLGQPNFGYFNVSFLYKNYTAIDSKDTSENGWQVTLVWGQPFSVGSLNFDFRGFMDIWNYEDEVVVLTEPQFLLKLDSFVGKGNFLSDSAIGTEIEISNRFFNRHDGEVYINPTIFWMTRF